MRKVIQRLGRNSHGGFYTKTQFINDDTTNYLAKAQSYFTKEEKKAAKREHKKQLNEG